MHSCMLPCSACLTCCWPQILNHACRYLVICICPLYAVVDETLVDELRVTLIATGFPQTFEEELHSDPPQQTRGSRAVAAVSQAQAAPPQTPPPAPRPQAPQVRALCWACRCPCIIQSWMLAWVAGVHGGHRLVHGGHALPPIVHSMVEKFNLYRLGCFVEDILQAESYKMHVVDVWVCAHVLNSSIACYPDCRHPVLPALTPGDAMIPTLRSQAASSASCGEPSSRASALGPSAEPSVAFDPVPK